ncbi:hypothetical protein ACWGIN_11165 [Streptomyces sp. NPDC054861]
MLMRWSETVLGLLAEAGVDGERRVVALRGLLAYVVGAIQLEHLGSLSGPGTAVIAELPAGRFPHLAEAARRGAGSTPTGSSSAGSRSVCGLRD